MAWDQDFLDTFLGYPLGSGSPTALGKWTAQNILNSGVGEDGSQCISAPNQLSKTLPSSSTGRLVGMRGKMTAVSAGTGVSAILYIKDSSANIRFILEYVESTGALRINPPDNSTSVGATITSATAFPPNNSWQTIEVGLFYTGVTAAPNNTAIWEVKVNGVTVADLSGSIGNSTTPTLQQIQLGSGAGSPGLIGYSHIWSKKYSGSGVAFAAGDFLGNVQRGILRPDAEGSNYPPAVGTRWSPISGSTFFEMVDETLADSGTSYILNTTTPTGAINDKASWRFSNSASTIQTVKMVQRQTLLRLAVGTSATFKMGIGATGQTGDTQMVFDSLASNSPSAFTFHLTQYPTDPRVAPNGGAWTKAKLDTIDGAIQLVTLTA